MRDAATPSTIQKYLTPFSKGMRQCVGTNLGYAELYPTIAATFAACRFCFELFETDFKRCRQSISQTVFKRNTADSEQSQFDYIQ